MEISGAGSESTKDSDGTESREHQRTKIFPRYLARHSKQRSISDSFQQRTPAIDEQNEITLEEKSSENWVVYYKELKECIETEDDTEATKTLKNNIRLEILLIGMRESKL